VEFTVNDIVNIVTSDGTARHEARFDALKYSVDSIRVQTEGSRNHIGAANTFMISSRLAWPAVAITTVPPTSSTVNLEDAGPLYALTEQEVPYEYQVLVNRGTVDLPGYEAVMGLTKIKRTITYTITRKRMDLELLPPCTSAVTSRCAKDLVRTPWLVCSTGCTQINDNHAITGGGLHLIHPNVDIRLKIDGEDATEYMTHAPNGDIVYFEIVRRRRTWLAKLLSDNENVGAYKPVTDAQGMDNLTGTGWYDDHTGRIGGRMTRPNWVDMPSSQFADPASWPAERMVEEFLVGVKRFPEFGFIYFATMIDSRPGGWYRVRQTDSKPITEREWCSIERTSAPYLSSARVHDTGWKRIPRP
jgi:hypothetical protein